MSRTDAHRPWWVLEEDEGYLRHDHRQGVCEEAIPGRFSFPGYSSRYRHRRRCKKYHRYLVTCAHHVSPHREEDVPSPALAHRRVADCEASREQPLKDYGFLQLSQACSWAQAWGEELLTPEGLTQGEARQATAAHWWGHACRPWREGSLLWHRYLVAVREEERPCSCDTWEAAPPCERLLPESHAAKRYHHERRFSGDADAPPRSRVKQELSRWRFEAWDEEGALREEDALRGWEKLR